MKSIKRIFVFILALSLCASLSSIALAKSDKKGEDGDKKENDAYALSADVQALKTLGLLIGTGKDGLTLEYSKSKPTRMQGFVIYLRLINQELNLNGFPYHDGLPNFDDCQGQGSYVRKVMAYAKAHPELNWVGSNGKFNPMAHLTAKEYAKIMLTSLGYQYNADFTWSTVESFAEGKGLNVPKGDFTIETLASMTVQTLYLTKAGASQTLIDYLASINPEFAAKVALLKNGTTPDQTVLTATYSAAVDVYKLQVSFSNPMKTIDPNEFRLYKSDGTTLASVGTGYTLDAAGKTATITLGTSLTTAAKAVETDATTAKLAIGTANTKDVYGNALSGAAAVPAVSAATPATVTILDKIAPVILSAETQDLDKDGHLDAVRLTFSKSIKDSTVDAGSFDVIGYSHETFKPDTAGDTANNNVIYISIAESSAPDTGITPAIKYTQGTLADTAGNKLASAGPIVTADKAAPVVMNALPAGVLTAGSTASSATLVLSEDITEASRIAVSAAVQLKAAFNDLGTAGDLGRSFVWTTNSLFTAAVTANANGGVNPDNIVLNAAAADLADPAGNITTGAPVVK